MSDLYFRFFPDAIVSDEFKQALGYRFRNEDILIKALRDPPAISGRLLAALGAPPENNECLE
jgi:dsRNA-specific ribonuclease